MQDITSILKDIEVQSASSSSKGSKFESLVSNYLQTDPAFASSIDKVWLWSDFPYNSQFGGHDIGIDIVVLDKDGEYWAVQCKFYAEKTTVSMDAVSNFVATSAKSFTDDNGTQTFARRYWVDTLAKLNKNAASQMTGHTPSIQRIGVADLASAPVDWDAIYHGGKKGESAIAVPKKEPRQHQADAIAAAKAHFEHEDRGTMVMACGTGKTFTSLRIAEEIVFKEKNGSLTLTNGANRILFLVPSIALMSQTVREWKRDSRDRLFVICVCSDADVESDGKKSDSRLEDISAMTEPATTKPSAIASRIRTWSSKSEAERGRLVIFSTYQSIDKVSQAQRVLNSGSVSGLVDEAPLSGGFVFDLAICDEAHRTTGVKIADEDESAFMRIHDDSFIHARKRLYMTATPRVYAPETKTKASENSAQLASMDDESVYGRHFYRISFGQAVEQGILSDYKVVVLTLDGAHSEREDADSWLKVQGSIAALSKITLSDDKLLYADDPQLMHTAVAFCPKIPVSKDFCKTFNAVEKEYTSLARNELKAGDPDSSADYVNIKAEHVDGTMSALQRNNLIQWLKDTPADTNECRILTNVRCLSEGVDVPALDAAIFLSPRDSQVEIIQAVGRVMRKHERKRFGYIIVPIFINTVADSVPDDASDEDRASKILDDHSNDYQILWKVLSALRSHDERLEILVNNPDLSPQSVSRPEQESLSTGSVCEPSDGLASDPRWNPILFDGAPYHIPADAYKRPLYARMVQKVGDRRYWAQWAMDIASIVERHKAQIKQKIHSDAISKAEFDSFVSGLRTIINSSVSDDSAIEMLAQQMVTKPVFSALFKDAEFASKNPVSRSMDRVLEVLGVSTNDSRERDSLSRFYESVQKRAASVTSAEGRQKIIIELYDSFFRNAFPKMVEQLGIVYTPVEVVDFIINSVDTVLRRHFSRSLSDEGVNIIDPFTGTGTFIVRLLQSGLIRPEDLERKYSSEIHANEIVLLAYYIAAINIENAYHFAQKESGLFADASEYKSFDGICLTDTFHLYENKAESEARNREQKEALAHILDDMTYTPVFPIDSRRLISQQKTPIQVVIGNPPYSVGQKSANDNARRGRSTATAP